MSAMLGHVSAVSPCTMDNTTQTVNVRPPVWALIGAVVVGGCFYIAGKHIETDTTEAPSTITVSGEGKVTATPDIAQVTVGVQTKRLESSEEVLVQLEKSMAAALKAIKAAGVEDEDISTQQLSMNPMYDYTQNGQVFRGYEGSQGLIVKVRDLEKVGDVISAASRAGANQIGNISFTIDDPKALQAEAREKAIADAKEQAIKLADQLDVRLDELVSFSEGGGGYYPPMPYARMEMAMGATPAMDKDESLVLPAGQQEIVVNVSMTYEIE